MTAAETFSATPLKAIYEEGATLLQNGQMAAAAQRFEALLEREPRHVPTLQLLGIIRARQARLEEAVTLLTKATQIDPNSAEAHNNLGLALHACRRTAEAVPHFETALRLNPTYAIACNNLGMALATLGELQQALVSYERALELQPRYVEALNDLGNALLKLDRPVEAVERFQKALATRPAFVEARMNLGLALQQLGRSEEAVAELQLALAANPEAPLIRLNLGNALYALNRHDEAIVHFRAASACDPKMARAATNLAIALKEMGRLEEACKAYETALSIEPRQPAHLLGLVGTRKTVRGDAHLTALEELVREEATLPAADRVPLHFAFGAALADIGEHERSFRHLTRGNALKRSTFRYDEKKVLGRLQRTREVFTAGLMQSKQGSGDPSRLPVFIVGMPRSGSTLVEQVLAAHPAVFAAGELNDFREALRVIDGQSGGYPENVPEYSPAQFDFLARDYLDRVTRAARGSTPQRTTDKLPANFRYAGLIHLALPNARIIHTRRDPLDTCLSCYSTLFTHQPFTYDLAELGRYYREYALLMEHWRAVLPPGILLEIQYEELVSDFDAQARRIVEHCGLDWDEACLAFHNASRPVKTASFAQVRQPVYRSSVGRWRPDDVTLQPLLLELQRVTCGDRAK